MDLSNMLNIEQLTLQQGQHQYYIT